MAPSSEIHAGAFECKSACDSCTDPSTRACHEYTFVFEALHTFLSYLKYEGYAARWRIHHHAADHSHSSIRNQDARVLATENSFDFVCHSMNILVQHKVACIQPNQLGLR